MASSPWRSCLLKFRYFPSWTVLMLCDRTFPGTHNIPTYTPQIGSPWQTKLQISNPTWWWNEFGVTFWNMTEGFLAEAEMTPGLHSQGPPQHRWGFTEAGSWEPGALCTVCRQLNRWKSILSKWLSCSQLLLGSSAFASSQLLALAQFYLRMG